MNSDEMATPLHSPIRAFAMFPAFMSFAAPAAIAAGAAIQLVRPSNDIVISTVTPEFKRLVNQQIPANRDPVVTDASLKNSAVGTGFTSIPLPAFSFNRNEGAWLGAMAPIFRANAKGQVEDVILPIYLHNNLIGEWFELNYFGYRDETRQFHATVSKATKFEHQLDLSYNDAGYDDGRYIVALDVTTTKTGFERFYGFGNRVGEQLESNFAKRDTVVNIAAGVNLTQSFSVLATERFHNVNVENGVVTSISQTLQAFPHAPGIDGADIWTQGVVLAYDTRDNQLTPLKGVYATAKLDYNRNDRTDSRNAWWRTKAEVRSFTPHAGGHAVFVARGLFDGIPGGGNSFSPGSIPFYERPMLGGENTLRAFGLGRFVSNYALLLNFEERVAVVERSILGNIIELGVTPFLDIGRVGARFTTDRLIKNIQVNPGVGLRLLMRPNVATRMDVAYGRDGFATFIGLDYPF